MQILPEMTSLSFVHPTTALPCMKYYSNIFYLTWVELSDVLNWTSLAKCKTEVGFQLGLLLGFATLNDQCSNRNPQQTCRKMLTVTLKNDKGKQLITRQLTNSKKTTWSAAVGGRKDPKFSLRKWSGLLCWQTYNWFHIWATTAFFFFCPDSVCVVLESCDVCIRSVQPLIGTVRSEDYQAQDGTLSNAQLRWRISRPRIRVK